jgi:Fibronectin type III domain
MAKSLKGLIGLVKLAPTALRVFAMKIYAGMNGNPAFPNPPVSMKALKTQIETYSALIVEALHGDRRVIAQRDRQGRVLIGMLRQLESWVQYVSGEDEAMFISSGFEIAKTTRNQTPPLSKSIRRIEFGDKSGELRLKAIAVSGAHSYEVRWAARLADGSGDKWIKKSFGSTKRYLTITGLTPGTFYLFQVRALLGTEFTDWSDSVTKMCK